MKYMDLEKIMEWTKNPHFAQFAEERIDAWMKDHAHTMEGMTGEFMDIHERLTDGDDVRNSYVAYLYYRILDALGTAETKQKERKLWWVFKVYTLDRMAYPQLAEGEAGGFAYSKIVALVLEILHREYELALKNQKKGKKSHVNKESRK